MSRQRGHLSDEEAQKRLKQDVRRRQTIYDADLKAVMSDAQGRRFVWRLLFDTLHVMDSVNSNVALELARHEGQRAVGVYLVNEVRRVCPTEFVHMQSEQLKAQQAEEALRDSAKNTKESTE